MRLVSVPCNVTIRRHQRTDVHVAGSNLQYAFMKLEYMFIHQEMDDMFL